MLRLASGRFKILSSSTTTDTEEDRVSTGRGCGGNIFSSTWVTLLPPLSPCRLKMVFSSRLAPTASSTP